MSTFALVGGGRWARVLAGVLAEVTLPFERVVVVSRAEPMARLLAGLAPGRFTLVASLDQLPADVGAAIVANAARQHFDATAWLLERGADVLVEKPLVLTSAEAHRLVEIAARRQVRLVPGLQYRCCAYLARLRDALKGRTPLAFALDWADAAGEVRYGEAKVHDASIDVAQDVMPHVWSILATVLETEDLRVTGGLRTALGARFDLVAGGVPGRVELARDAGARRRMLRVSTRAGDATLDFTTEPGTITIDGSAASADPDWSTRSRPLAAQLARFFHPEPGDEMRDVRACLASVALLERASALASA